MHTQKHQFFIGIDVSKKDLDYSILKGKCFVVNGKIKNTAQGLKKFRRTLEAKQVNLEKALFCCENTGQYNHQLLIWSQKENCNMWVENAVAIKKSMGLVRGKNDQIDAYRIALYASRFGDKCRLYEPPRKSVRDLKALMSTRKSILKTENQIAKKLKEVKETGDTDAYKTMFRLFKNILEVQRTTLKKIDEEIRRLTQKDEQLNRMVQIATSVEGVGMITAAMMIIYSNEFRRLSNPRKMACYAGVAPFPYSSGSSIRGRTKVSLLANKPLKAVLHMAALSAAYGKGELSAYYQRKIEQNNNKMSVLNAIRNKIIHRIYACIRDNRLYEKNYLKKFA